MERTDVFDSALSWRVTCSLSTITVIVRIPVPVPAALAFPYAITSTSSAPKSQSSQISGHTRFAAFPPPCRPSCAAAPP
eukprot:363384-Chlamydomonas_euryale.AAC.28